MDAGLADSPALPRRLAFRGRKHCRAETQTLRRRKHCGDADIASLRRIFFYDAAYQ